ncbi:GPALPP motifs-containing protein 1 [Aedes aegypti]|uniref:DUF3752 domain-containing protein n=1 Tax=Aedes aegypti TaxID=7159 RepID=A0A903UUZ4_AEDAE|nr:GPALPP motifs-containing protein 1 [Aedes aegypti]
MPANLPSPPENCPISERLATWAWGPDNFEREKSWKSETAPFGLIRHLTGSGKKAIGHSSKDTTRDREQEEERRRVAERDKQQADMVKRHKKKHKRDKSLLELHQKKAKKEKKKKDAERDPDEPTRRPFDRNIDLHANRFDEAQKKAIFKKAQLLDTRFSSGASKYL